MKTFWREDVSYNQMSILNTSKYILNPNTLKWNNKKIKFCSCNVYDCFTLTTTPWSNRKQDVELYSLLQACPFKFSPFQ